MAATSNSSEAHELVRRIALEMPGAFEKASYGGQPSWRTKSRMFLWIRGDLADDPGEALVIWVDSLDEKEAMLASEPGKFLTTPHYDGIAMILVDLRRVDEEELRELIVQSWRLRATKTALKQWDAENPPAD